MKRAYFGSFLLALVLHALVFGVMWRSSPIPVRAVAEPVVLIRSIEGSTLPLQADAGNAPQADSPAAAVAKPLVHKPEPKLPVQPKARTQTQIEPLRFQPEHSLKLPKQRTPKPPVTSATGSDPDQSSTAVAAPTSSSASKAAAPSTATPNQAQADATGGENKNAKPSAQGSDSKPKPALGSICTHTAKPEMPASEMVFDAWITVTYKIDDGKINRVDLIGDKYSIPVDQKTRKSFFLAIKDAAEKYVCRGTYVGVQQEFYFRMREGGE